MHRIVARAFVPLAAVGILLLAGGTAWAEWNAPAPLAWIPGLDEKPQTPASVVAVWTNAVLQQGNGPATRGFGGRLMFYGPNGDKPIRVDGTLVVYAFDEQRSGPNNPRPDRKYAFTREQLAEHHSKSKLGSSYSIWIPWDKAGAPAQQVSLIVRFNPVGAAAIVGNQTKLTLPGHAAPAPDASGNPIRDTRQSPEGAPSDEPSDQVRPAAHFTPLPARRIGQRPGPARRQMDTTTIPLPPQGR